MMKNNMFNLTIIVAVVVLLISFAYLPVKSNAAEVWSDDFDDGDCQDWEVWNGAFMCEHNYLECSELDSINNHSTIYHESNVSNGTWSFDFYLPESQLNVFLLSSDTGSFVGGLILVIDSSSFKIYKGAEYEANLRASWQCGREFRDTWTQIDITIDEDWNINLFVNGTHRINLDVFPEYEPWRYFKITSYHVGQAIDNIVVSDTIDIQGNETLTTTTTTETTTPTDTTPPPGIPMEWLPIGIGVPVILVIVLVVWKIHK